MECEEKLKLDCCWSWPLYNYRNSRKRSENYWPVFYKTFTDAHNILNMTLESNS